MGRKITLAAAKEYLIASIVYLSREPNNFVTIFRNMKDKTLPPVRAVVKRREEPPVVTVSSSNQGVKITDRGVTEFKSMATEAVSSLYCENKGEADG